MRSSRSHPLALILLALFAPLAAGALDAQDTGTFRVLDADNRPSQRLIRITGVAGDWRIEERQGQGPWRDLGCDGACPFAPSSAEEIAGFFPAEDLDDVVMDCLHNRALAFCRYELRAIPTGRAYLLVGLKAPRPEVLRLKRIP